jgi:hypothetical protein
MAKYYVPFVNINTFIYEPCGLESDPFIEYEQSYITNLVDIKFLNSAQNNFTSFELDSQGSPGYMFNNVLGNHEYLTTTAPDFHNFISLGDLGEFKNHLFSMNLPTTASFFTALNLKRNGPYGYPTWKQIRAHENPLTRNQKKRNILTVLHGESNVDFYNQSNGPNTPYSDPRTIEVFKEPVFSSRESNLVVTFALNSTVYRTSIEMGSQIKYFDNDRLNQLYAPYDFSDELQTDASFKENFVQKTFNIIGGSNRPILAVEYSHAVFPQKSSLEYNKRVRSNFYHPWKDKRSQRKKPFVAFNGIELFDINYVYYNNNSSYVTEYTSRWLLDPYLTFLTSNSSSMQEKRHFLNASDNGSPGKLQHITKYFKDLQSQNRGSNFFESLTPLPMFSYNHTITPLTSCVGPHGMDIEGVNDGTLFSDLDLEHIPSGEANWDAGSQYGTNPFYNSYQEFVYDIKKVGKEYSFVPEFRSSLYFNELQDNKNKTPFNFLEILGGKILNTSNNIGYYQNTVNTLGTKEIGHVSASSLDNNFFQTYSHSDFMKNFDVVQEVTQQANKPLRKMSLTCKGIKKFVPYEGFYPAERTVQISETFRDSIIDNCFYSGSGTGDNIGDILTTDRDRYVYFNNIMTPMFAPGIMFNSIKSGLAVDYPIHTESLTLTNGGVRLYEDNYYIQKPFDERIPFESLLEPADHLASKEIHCSEPHPSGNLSGSVTWDGTGDTSEYQLMMHNFLAETANFFLQDQNFSFISSGRSDEINIQLDSGSTYGFDISLYKSQNRASERQSDGTRFYPSLYMTGSGIQETFTMYSRPSAFGPPSRITSSISSNDITSSYSDLGYNYAFTPPYYDGISKITFIYKATETKNHTISEIFNNGVFIEQRASDLTDPGTGVLVANVRVAKHALNNINDIEDYLNIASMPVGHSTLKNSMTHAKTSLNINLGILKDIDLLDDDTSDTVKVAVDISSEKKSQIIIQPKWETPMFNFQAYSDSDTISLPLVGSQSVPRGIWHQYGAIETDPSKGVFMQITNINDNPLFSEIGIDVPLDLARKLKFSTAPVKLGKTASKKVVREAIVAVPFYDYTPGARNVEEERKFFNIPRGVFDNAVEGKGKQNVVDMVNSMKRFVMPPMFNFLEDPDLDPVTMYIFEFKHTFDQEDLAAIWQNLPPKLMTEFQTEDKTISHTFEGDELLSFAAIENAGDPQKIMKKLRWMVFKVKQKAEQNYYDKIVGETQKLNKKSPYSHNWPYDYFSLVELAKIETKVDFAHPPPPAELVDPTGGGTEGVANIPGLGNIGTQIGQGRGTIELTPRKNNRKALLGDVTPVPNNKKNKNSPKIPEKRAAIPSKPKGKKIPKIDNKTNNVKQPISNPPKTRKNKKNNKKSGLNNLGGTKR